MFSSSEIETIRSTARSAPGCHQGCGVILHVQNGKLIKVTGDRDFPFNQGVLCPRCRALPEVVYHPDRLKYPLKRIGKKGGGKWERISWEEAFETISSNFNNFKFLYGAESVLFCTVTQRDIAGYLNRLADSFGSPHSLSFGPLLGHACFVPRIAASMITMGDLPVADCSQYFKERWNNPQ